MIFELDWLGGAAERAFAPHRGDIDAFPWGTMQLDRYDLVTLDQARIAWTTSAQQEWCAAAGFSLLLTELLKAGAPVDLVGMAGRFVADEMVHTELNARVASELGGGVALTHDPEAMCPVPDPALPALERAIELAIRISCVGETFSLPVLTGLRGSATEPLIRSVMRRLVRDEAPHARLGWLVLDWGLEKLEPGRLDWLGQVTDDAVDALAPLWEAEPAEMSDEVRHALGWLSPDVYRKTALHTVEHRIRAPMRARGVPLG